MVMLLMLVTHCLYITYADVLILVIVLTVSLLPHHVIVLTLGCWYETIYMQAQTEHKITETYGYSRF